MENQYTSVKAVSQDIIKVIDLSDSLKSLYYHKETVDEQAVRKYESDFSDRKFSVIQWLSNDDNYNTFKNSPDAKAAMFFKSVNDGYYDNEIGLDSSLKDKIYRDFKPVFENTPHEELMSNQDKKTLKHYEENNVAEDNRSFFKKEALIVATVFSKSKCFQKAWEHFNSHLPGKEALDANAKKVLETIKSFPHFLNDHPNHFLVNKADYKNKAPNLSQLNDVIHDSSLGNPNAKEKMNEYIKLLTDFAEKNPQKLAVNEVREKANPNSSNENNLKLK